MTKVTIPKEIADEIELLRREGNSDSQIVFAIESCCAGGILNEYYFDVGTSDELMQALVNGYQVEETPKLPIVTPEHFGALNLLSHHYRTLESLLAEYSAIELDDLVRHGYRTK